MSKFTIDKTFSFCYGHRVWSQRLNPEYCEKNDYQCKCRHLHGHEGLAHVFLEATDLERGMVTDFKHLGWLKDFINTYVDHKFIIDTNDPMCGSLIGDVWNQIMGSKPLVFRPVWVPGTAIVVGHEVDLSGVSAELASSPEYETLEGYFIVNFVPTSENLSKWLHTVASTKMALLGVKVSRVDWFETPKSRSSYQP